MPDFEAHLFVGGTEAVRMTLSRPDLASAEATALGLISGAYEFDWCELWEQETRLAIINPVRPAITARATL